MTEELQHDPMTKQRIKNILYESLYAPVKEQFNKRLEAIINKNTTLISSSHRSFVYRKEFYTLEPGKPPIKLNHLVTQLKPTMDEYLKEMKELNDVELPYVLGFINQTLNASNSLQDYFRILPESMHPPLKTFVDTCPCKHQSLTEAKIKELHEKNTQSISLIKQRMVKNMIT